MSPTVIRRCPHCMLIVTIPIEECQLQHNIHFINISLGTYSATANPSAKIFLRVISHRAQIQALSIPESDSFRNPLEIQDPWSLPQFKSCLNFLKIAPHNRTILGLPLWCTLYSGPACDLDLISRCGAPNREYFHKDHRREISGNRWFICSTLPSRQALLDFPSRTNTLRSDVVN